MHLQTVQVRDVPDLWPLIRDRLVGCCDRSGGKYAPIDVLHNLLVGRMQLWIAVDERSDSRESLSGAEAPRTAEREGRGSRGLRSLDISGRRGGSREAARMRALAITEIVPYPRITVCKLLACTGEDAHRWVDLLAGIEAWAKERGCGVLEPICRPGWERHLKPMGYVKTHVVLEKRL